MIYLIKNEMINSNMKTYELINVQKEKLIIRMSTRSIYQVGDFVVVTTINGKTAIDSKVVKPANFLDFYPQGKLNVFQLKEQTAAYINRITNDDLRMIVDELITNNEDFYLFPAAKTIHHAYIGGLCEHTLSMLKIADSYRDIYEFDEQLLFAGILLHDFGKLRELQDYGVTYTVEGNLLGHIAICYEEIVKVMARYDMVQNDILMQLKHLILVHHGKLEYGSPKLPMTIEGYLLSQLDETDAKMNLLVNSLSTVESGNFSHPINGFDRRKFYKG